MSSSSRESSLSSSRGKSSIETAQRSPRSNSGGSIPPPREGAMICLVCGEGFPSVKSMFGHMKNHKSRGWKGAYPPPAFDYETEFAEYKHLLVKPMDQQEEEIEAAGEGIAGQASAPAPGGPRGVTVPDLNASPEKGEAAGEYLLPDLNFPPSRFL
nr:protein VASP homolog [Ipomoea batatas]GME09911.1 protein VASP homolog [Ipomoea batatas]GME13769.1 protein VASP homolog [Ipomoea batatas]